MDDPADHDLTPEEARVRFGSLLDPRTRTHCEFERPEGLWRPVLGDGMRLASYRLFPKPKSIKTFWPKKPKRR